MGKIKFQGGLTKLITSNLGKRNKAKFAKFVEEDLPSLLNDMKKSSVQVDIVSFSSHKDFYDQVLSILSFMRYLGTPSKWTIYSDGSHTLVQIQLLKRSFDFIEVEIEDWEKATCLPIDCKEVLVPYEDKLFDYAKNRPLGRKAFYYLNHKIERPTLFLDADIIFYNMASVIERALQEKVDGWYLPDPDWGCLDSRYKKYNSEQLYQLNGGFIIFNNEPPNLYDSLEFLKSLGNQYEYFTDQTIFHIISRSNKFLPLDPRIFIINSADQFDFSYLYQREKMAVRHYTGPVRHKMWQKDWKWHLSLS